MGGTYQGLKVWQAGMDLTLKVYRTTQKFPADEVYGLRFQMRRPAVSFVSNIAEGKGRPSDKELLQFLNRARGSLFELETQLEIAHSLGYVDALLSHTHTAGKMLNGMIAKIRQSVQEAA